MNIGETLQLTGIAITILSIVFYMGVRIYNQNHEPRFGTWREETGSSIIVLNLVLWFVLGMGIGISHTFKKYHEEGLTFSYELISLKRTSEISGELAGGSILGGSFSGSIKTGAACQFITKDSNGVIRIKSIPFENIQFYEASDKPIVQKFMKTFYRPHSTNSNMNKEEHLWWREDAVIWKIWIPKDSINHYIKFN